MRFAAIQPGFMPSASAGAFGGPASARLGGRRFSPALLVVIAIHVAAGWVLLQTDMLRKAVTAAAPLMVNLVESAPPQAPPPTVLPPPRLAPPPQLLAIVPEIQVAAQPAAIQAPPAPAEPVAVQQPVVAPVQVAAVPAPLRTVSASEATFLTPLQPEYPRYSKKLHEHGTVLLKVLIDEEGLPRQVLVQQSSGFERLDDAAVQAMRRVRFKPFVRDGIAVAVWATSVPIGFDL